MKHLYLVCLIAASTAGGFGQAASGDLGGGGVQFSGLLSANLINDFGSSTAYFDNGGGLSYLQLDASLKDGPYGFDSEILFGPGAVYQFKYMYGYANFANGRVYLAAGRWVDPSTFALISYFQGGADGPGSYGNPSVSNKNGGVGFGVDGFELKLSPVKDLVFGFLLPYQSPPNDTDTVNTSLRRLSGAASYTLEKLVQVVVGYGQGHTGVADLAVPINIVGQNKLYALANVLVSDDLTLGARYELDHFMAGSSLTLPDVSEWHVISHNGYFTLGGKLGDFSLGGDVGVFFPVPGPAGFEVLTAASYTLHAIATGVDLQPYAAVSYFSSSYQGNTVNSFTINPQLRLLLGKSQHELAVGYTLTYDLDHRLATLDQLNFLIQVYF
jgi:hypothetical protein